jgi:transcriptional regulator with XRE-family HTH domain
MEGQAVTIGARLRELRKQKNLSQAEVGKRTGLLRCNMWRLENGYTVPAVKTLQKFARALEIPMYQLFYDREEPPKLLNIAKRRTAGGTLWGNSGKDARMLSKFCRLFRRMKEGDLKLVMFMARKMAKRKSR